MYAEELYEILEERFIKNTNRHETIKWESVKMSIEKNNLLASLLWMEETGGEPDVVLYQNQLYYVDFSKESPNRRSLCYDEEARVTRKKFPPTSSALEECLTHHVELLSEDFYRFIQSIEAMDLKTSSWLNTPSDVRDKKGAIFGDRRYDRVFVYHNGADSYYGARGFRTALKLSERI